MMANEEQLTILRRGGKRWNEWLKGNPIQFVDLRFADLRNARLSEAYLAEADLYRANLVKADLCAASLGGTNLVRADLRGAYLRGADLSGADLNGANLAGVDLRAANLSKANLVRATLVGADLSGSDLVGANLGGANLIDVDLVLANLSGADLSLAQALGTNFNNAIFTAACIEDWHVNSETNFNGVICDFIYLKGFEEERRPSDLDRYFASGEFVKLIQKIQATVDLIFSNGINWQAFLPSFQDLRVEYGDQNLVIQAIENKDDGAFVIRLNVPPDADKGAIERHAMELYETRRTALEAQYRLQLQAKDEQIAIYREKSADLTEIVKLLASKPTNVKAIAVTENQSSSETYHNDMRGAYIANSANKLEGNAWQQANQNNYAPEQKQSLTEAAAEIQGLLEQLQHQGVSLVLAQQKVAGDLAVQAQRDRSFQQKLSQWCTSLRSEIPTGVAAEAVIEVIKSAARLAGLPVS